ncbi:MAG: hypothetical protein WKG07_39685 [Hymenobacter sp.]
MSRLQQAQPAEAVDLAALVRRTCAWTWPPRWPSLAPNCAWTWRPAPACCFAPQNLRSIVYNLLSNAVKYRDPARPAVVALRATATAAGYRPRSAGQRPRPERRPARPALWHVPAACTTTWKARASASTW